MRNNLYPVCFAAFCLIACGTPAGEPAQTDSPTANQPNTTEPNNQPTQPVAPDIKKSSMRKPLAFAPSPADQPCLMIDKSVSASTQVTSYGYDANGRLIQKDWGYPSEAPKMAGIEHVIERGVAVQVRTRFYYDSSDNLIREEEDRGMTGVPTTVTSHRYNPDGHLVEETVDQENDGSVDARRTFERDKGGRVLKMSNDEDGDGKLELVETTRYKGKQTITEIDKDADGSVDRTKIEKTVSKKLSQTEFKRKNGTPATFNTKRTFDEGGNMVREESEMRMGGRSASRTVKSFMYDAQNRKVKMLHDGDANGEPEGTTTWRYSCDWEKENSRWPNHP